MNYSQNPPKHPELGPGYSGQPIENTRPTNGSLTFNQSISSSGEPRKIIAAAIAAGDSMNRRTEQFQQAVDTEQK